MSATGNSPASSRPYLVPGLIAAIALVLAVLPLPYGYYQFLRLLVPAMAIWSWVLVARSGQWGWLGLIIPAILLWNPILPVGLERGVWVLPDLAGAVAFGVVAAVRAPNNVGGPDA